MPARHLPGIDLGFGELQPYATEPPQSHPESRPAMPGHVREKMSYNLCLIILRYMKDGLSLAQLQFLQVLGQVKWA